MKQVFFSQLNKWHVVLAHRKKIGKCKIALISRNMYTTYAIVNSAAIDLTEAATALYCLLPS